MGIEVGVFFVEDKGLENGIDVLDILMYFNLWYFYERFCGAILDFIINNLAIKELSNYFFFL